MEKKIVHWIGGMMFVVTGFIFILYCRSLPSEKPDISVVGRQNVSVSRYPIIKWVKVHRSSWSEPIVVSEMEQMSWICYDSVPILVSDDGQVYRQAISSHLDTKGVRDHRTTRFMIDPNAYPAVVETTMECTITAR